MVRRLPHRNPALNKSEAFSPGSAQHGGPSPTAGPTAAPCPPRTGGRTLRAEPPKQTLGINHRTDNPTASGQVVVEENALPRYFRLPPARSPALNGPSPQSPRDFWPCPPAVYRASLRANG